MRAWAWWLWRGSQHPHTVEAGALTKGQAPCRPARCSLPQPSPLLLTGAHSGPWSHPLWGQTQHDCLGLQRAEALEDSLCCLAQDHANES